CTAQGATGYAGLGISCLESPQLGWLTRIPHRRTARQGAVAQPGCGTPVGAVVELMARGPTRVCQSEDCSALLGGGLWSISPAVREGRSCQLQPRLVHLDHRYTCTGSGNGFRALPHVGYLPLVARREDHLTH